MIFNNTSLCIYDNNGNIIEEIKKKPQNNSIELQILNFIDEIDTNKLFLDDYSFHLQHMAFIEACYLSEKLKQPINPHELLNKTKNLKKVLSWKN